MYVIKSKKTFHDLEEAIQFLLSVIAEAGVEEEFDVIEIREDLCGIIKDLWNSETAVSEKFKKLSEEIKDPVQKLHATNLAKEYDRHVSSLFDKICRLNCWEKKSS